MTELRADLPPIPTVADFARAFKPSMRPLVEHIAATIQQSVSGYRGGAATQPVTNAVAGALVAFAESLIGPSATGPKVDRLFRQMGYVEAQRDEKLADFYLALYLSVREGTQSLRDAARDFGLDADGVEHVSRAVFVFTDHLAERARSGREAALTRAAPRTEAREALIHALVQGREAAPELAIQSDWTVPAQMVVVAGTGMLDPGVPVPSALLVRENEPLVICAPDDVPLALEHLKDAAPIAVTWPVSATEIPQAVIWAKRIVTLAQQGVIDPLPVIYCNDFRTQIWLHAEPALRQRLCQELLRPLLAETPNSREILSETLLAWLESRDSAPAIAGKLGVHPQTIRYRWKRINELFGEDLHDSEFVVQVTMLLKASVPLWKAGDQSDFERFEAEELMSNG